MTLLLSELVRDLDEWLAPRNWHDYAPNGLQVQGGNTVHHVVTGVTASLELIERAADVGADTLVVHHGWFWKGEDARIVGLKQRRVARLLAAGISLIAYHLPLDGHPEFGNNAQIARRLGVTDAVQFGEQNLGWCADLAEPCSTAQMTDRLQRLFARAPLVVGPENKIIRRAAWCSGAAQDMIEEAAAMGADCFISGEISERTTHAARELAIPYFSCGHHATERFGIEALGRRIAERYADRGVSVTFIDVDNPV
ncbi:MAG: Nif3-like dinuclear metal center hexameric protein [Duodenibacillus sp.]